MSVVELLLSVLEEFNWVSAQLSQEKNIIAEVDTFLADGGKITYFLTIEVVWPRIIVKENDKNAKLPKDCPMRHINYDASFCIGWENDQNHINWPKSRDEAVQWWQRLGGYLKLQNIAQLTKRWPSEYEWPHGPEAALAQFEYEQFSKTLPYELYISVNNKSLNIREGFNQLKNRRKACPCKSGRKVKNCHENDIVYLIILNNRVRSFEEIFWRGKQNTRCCQTMKDCPLSRGCV